MATERALAIKSELAAARIEASITALGVEVSLPKVNKDKEILRAKQLETIADALEQVQVDAGDNEILAAARELIRSDRWTKADIERLLTGEYD